MLVGRHLAVTLEVGTRESVISARGRVWGVSASAMRCPGTYMGVCAGYVPTYLPISPRYLPTYLGTYLYHAPDVRVCAWLGKCARAWCD